LTEAKLNAEIATLRALAAKETQEKEEKGARSALFNDVCMTWSLSLELNVNTAKARQ
jgi:hypothetical protein